MTIQVSIRGLGLNVPSNIVTNADLEKIVDTSDEWITTRTGIKSRHVAANGETCSDLALGASLKALDEAGLTPEDLTHIFVATLTPDYVCPSAACMLQDRLGIKGRTVMDMNAACSGFLYTLQMARATIALEPEAKVLIAPSDVLSTRTNWNDRSTCVLFGDGSGAAVITKANAENAVANVDDVILSSDGSLAKFLTIRGGGSYRSYKLNEPMNEEFFIQMKGREVYKQAVRSMEEICLRILKKNNLSLEEVDVFVPHQANLRIIEAVGKKLGYGPDKVFVNVDRFGNTSAASVPIALADARETGFIKPGNKVLVSTFGGGFTWGSALLSF